LEYLYCVEKRSDACPTDLVGDGELKAALNDAINRMNDFIVANRNNGVTKDALQDRINKQVLAARETLSGLSDDERAKKCAAGDVAKMLDRFRSFPSDKIKKGVDELLSVPRPPVMNPCL
jgi:hypothetical protein